jgi:hypothetical protein
MINFNVCQAEIIYPIKINKDNTVFELKATVVGLFNTEFEALGFYLETIGNLDDENLLELPLECLGLSIV